MAREIHPVNLWPQAGDEVKAHAVSLVVGRYFTTPTLLSRFELSDWLCLVAVFLESETRKIVAECGEQLPELPQTHEGPILAQDMIYRWKTQPALHEQHGSFLGYAESVERAIERGVEIDSKDLTL